MAGVQREYNLDLRFVPGSTTLFVGVAGTGKSSLIFNILRYKHIAFANGASLGMVIYCYKVWQDEYDRARDEGLVNYFHEGALTNAQYVELVTPYKQVGSVVIFDDCLDSLNEEMVKIITTSARHLNCHTFFLYQSLFPKNDHARAMSLNAKYLFVFKNVRDKKQFFYLAQQLSPKKYQWLMEAYHHATRTPYSYFVIDLTQTCKESYRMRSNITPLEWPMRMYMPRSFADSI